MTLPAVNATGANRVGEMTDERPKKQRRGLLAFVAAATAVLGLTLVAFQNVAAICAATGVLCPSPNGRASSIPPGWEYIDYESVVYRSWRRIETRPSEVIQQTVTVYEVPMSVADRRGYEVAPGEYVVVAKWQPSFVTIMVHVDLGTRWAISRQAFSTEGMPGMGGTSPFPDPLPYVGTFREEIDEARYTLRQFLAATGAS